MATTHTIVGTTPRGNPLLWPIVNIVALVATLIVNALANSLPLNGVSTGEISDRFPSLFTPAGYVFSIWGLIYLLLSAFAVYQALPSQRSNPRLERIGPLFLLSSLFNISWLVSWHYGVFWLSEVLMLGILTTLILIYRRLDIGRAKPQGAERWVLDLPFSVYLGWITVATVANTSILLLSFGFDGGSLAPLLTVVVLAVAAAIGVLALRLRGDVAFVLVLVWAFAGIAAKQSGQTPLVVVAATVAAAGLFVLVVLRVLSRPRSAAPR